MTLTALDYAKKAEQLCALPDVYLRLKEILDDEHASLDDIANVIMLDPALTTSLLKLANSAFFNFPREIDSISRALMVLGIKEVNNLINAYGTTKAFAKVNANIIDMDRFWEVSVDCALMCKYFAIKHNVEGCDGIFLSGLLHNVGTLAMIQSEDKKVVYCENYDSEETPWQRQEDVFGFTFADVSAELLRLWQLPDHIIKPIKEYHQAYAQELSPASSLLYITSRLALINSHPGMYSKKNFLGKHLMYDLGITMDDINEAIDFCNAEGLAILSALKLKN
ncbi:HDOD domain-containing protein [Thalassotalea piscium]|uniref:HD-like signal output (HDOD) protein n=1 Tax=Thalassotalea piscium TaxID=1230533 RepID=A0A7X0NJI2_9GAMM|nr:HDOD domain-containing protein [Thalassotalea piscium]MBB6544593.1 HD-like signal output (HDOD) protein [Thalassotalea piscium]